jgi:hypothetical protein
MAFRVVLQALEKQSRQMETPSVATQALRLKTVPVEKVPKLLGAEFPS